MTHSETATEVQTSTDDILPVLFKETALQYYAPEQLAQQLGLSLEKLEALLDTPEARAEVDRLKREATETGETFKLAANPKQLSMWQQLRHITPVAHKSHPLTRRHGIAVA